MIQVFWFFGLHGQILVNSVFDPIWYALNEQNLSAFQAGEELPNVVTKQFIDTFIVGMGGSGMTLAIVLWLFMLARSKQAKQLGKVGGPPGFFNVNEPIIFGLPIIMNPLVLIPWLVAPVVIAVITYVTMSIGLVPKPAGIIVPWTTPIFLSGFLATGNAWQGAVLQLFNLAVVFIIWFPFLRILDRQYVRNEVEGEKETTNADNKQKSG